MGQQQAAAAAAGGHLHGNAFALVSATLGPGEWSVDEGLGIANDFDGMVGFWIALLGGVGGGILQMVTFYRPSSVASGD